MPVRVRVSGDSDFPQVAGPVEDMPVNRQHRLDIQVITPFRQRVLFPVGFRFQDIGLTHVPGDIRETAALAMETDKLKTVQLLPCIYQRLLNHD